MRRRRFLFLTLFVLVAAAIAVVIYERVAPPPRAVRLLPEGNLLLYVNFSPAHFFDLGQLTAGQTDPQYQDFVQQTGFHFEKDLDTVAVSQLKPGDIDSESSAVFTGRFDQERLTSYLKKLSSSTENYADKTIYSIPHENHIVRACIVDAHTVAITNIAAAEPMHSIIDKSRNSHLMSKGPYLAENYYRHVPFASLAWAILRAPAQRGAQLPGGTNLDFLQNTTAVVSVRYTGSIRIRAEVFSPNDADAAHVTEAANTFLVLSRGAADSLNPGGPDKDIKAAFDSIQVQRTGNRTVVSIVIAQEVVKKMAAGMNR